jgi:hypothetical protein
MVRNKKSGFVDEFTKFAHEAIDAWSERGAELEGNMKKLVGDTQAFGLKFGEESKLGSYIENNPSRAALFSLMTGLMFTHYMKSRGMSFPFEAPGATETGATSKPKSTKKAA